MTRPRTALRRVTPFIVGIGLLAGCSADTDSDDASADPESSATVAEPAEAETTPNDDTAPPDEPAATDEPAAADADEPAESGSSDELFPDIVGAEVTAQTSTAFRFDVTVSSPYDTDARYADAWRVTDADGTVFGVRELTHGHQNEQPFTRSLSNVEIPEGTTEVVVEGRDILNGWGGTTLVVELPPAPESSDGESTSNDDVPFTVSVREFGDGEPIPQELTCDGIDASPTITLTAIPDGTRSYAFLVDDPDAPTDDPFVHWLLWGMDVTVREITTDQVGAIDGTNDFGETGWLGPCPPPGDGPHTYRFRLIALSEDSSDIEAGLDAREFLAEVDDLILEEVVYTGTYER